jgi:cold shock protein
MVTGIVKWYNPDKGYGFIVPDTRVNGGGDVFVHVSAVEEAAWDTLRDGMKIGFDIGTSARTGRSCAVNLKAL